MGKDEDAHHKPRKEIVAKGPEIESKPSDQAQQAKHITKLKAMFSKKRKQKLHLGKNTFIHPLLAL
jgi:hypothetical protein